MNSKYLVTIISLLISLTATNLQAKSNPAHQVETFTLKNGLQVVVVPNHRAPVIYHSLWYKTGSADSPLDKTGLAHFLEHLMFKGTKNYPGDAYKHIISQLGGEQNASTTWDRTAYFVTIAKEYLPKVMALEADRMQNLEFTEESVNKERTVVLQERRQRIDSNPQSRLAEAANASFFWQHPYGSPTIGFKEHIESYTLEDAAAFYQHWYAPNNAILVVAGDITAKDVKTLANQYYGAIPEKLIPKRNRLIEPQHPHSQARIELRDKQFSSMFFQQIFRAPNHKSTSIQSEIALTLLSDILGDQTYGRLTEALVEQQELAHYAVANYNGHLLDPYSFTIMVAPINAIDAPILEAAVQAEVYRILAKGVTQAELDKAKKEYDLAFRYDHDSLVSIANYYGEGLSHEYALSELDSWASVLETITLQNIDDAAKLVLQAPPQVIAYGYPISTN